MEPLIEVKNLKKYFATSKGTLHAVDDVNLRIEEGKTMGVVGESGCGKSTLGRTIIHLQESTDGKIFYKGEDITHVNEHKLKEIRKNMQIIFQDPYSSLNPRLTVEQTVQEPLRIAHHFSGSELEDETNRLMALVGIDRRMRKAYPHEPDGGRRQRVGIARALAVGPKFIVCDEPVSALDVSIQAQILNVLRKIQKERGISILFISHDLSVVKHISDEICVIKDGKIVESGKTKEVFNNPKDEYTKKLFAAVPSVK